MFLTLAISFFSTIIFSRVLLGVIIICVLVLSIYFMFLILFPLLWCFILPLLSFSLHLRLSFPFLLFHIHSSNPFLFPPLFLLLFPSLLTSRLTYLSPPSLQPNETGCAVPDSPPPFRFPEREKKKYKEIKQTWKSLRNRRVWEREGKDVDREYTNRVRPNLYPG